MYKLTITLLGLPPMMNRSGRSSHWRVIHLERQKVKAAIGLILRSRTLPAAPLKKAKLTLTRHSSVPPDPDGLVSGFKAAVDALVECAVLENDRFTNIGMPDYRWEKAKKNEGKLVISVEEIDAP